MISYTHAIKSMLIKTKFSSGLELVDNAKLVQIYVATSENAVASSLTRLLTSLSPKEKTGTRSALVHGIPPPHS